MQSISFVTSNPSKTKQLSYHLNYPVNHISYDLPEIQSLDLNEIIVYKAKEAYKLSNTTVLVEDTSLQFLALGKLPDPLIKWFLKELDNSGLCKLLNSYENRNALAEAKYCLYDGSKIKVFGGSMNGEIAHFPRGENGFGWDSIFIPKGHTKTWGEMDDKEQRQTSMRRIALQKLQQYLSEI